MQLDQTKGKRFYYKVYNGSDGSFNTVWHNEVMNKPSFDYNINGGHGELIIDLARKSSDFGEEDDVAIGNEVDLIVAFGDEEMEMSVESVDNTKWDKFDWTDGFWDYKDVQPTFKEGGDKIYHGIIRSYEPFIGGDKEFVRIHLSPYIVKLGDEILKTEVDGDTTIAFASEDPTTILTDIIDYQGNDFDYSWDTVNNTGTTVSYTFKFVTYREAIDKVIQLCPPFWYWYVDANDSIWLEKTDYDTVDHELWVGKEITKISATKRTEDLVNAVYFLGGGDPPLYNKYEISASIDKWGRREKKMKDSRVTIGATAQTMADRELNENSYPINMMTIEVVSNAIDTTRGYEIESIKPGDVLQVQHPEMTTETTQWNLFNWDEDFWDYNLLYSLGQPMQVLNLKYDYDTATIQLSSQIKDVVKRIEDINRNKDETDSDNIPTAPS